MFLPYPIYIFAFNYHIIKVCIPQEQKKERRNDISISQTFFFSLSH